MQEINFAHCKIGIWYRIEYYKIIAAWRYYSRIRIAYLSITSRTRTVTMRYRRYFVYARLIPTLSLFASCTRNSQHSYGFSFSIHGNRLWVTVSIILAHPYSSAWISISIFFCVNCLSARHATRTWKTAINSRRLESVAGEQTRRGPLRGSARWPQPHIPVGSALGRAPCEYLLFIKLFKHNDVFEFC